jgi:hypothetical protein
LRPGERYRGICRKCEAIAGYLSDPPTRKNGRLLWRPWQVRGRRFRGERTGCLNAVRVAAVKGYRDVIERGGQAAADRALRADHGNADQSYNEPVLDRGGASLVFEQFVQHRRQPKFLHNMSSNRKVEGRVGRAGDEGNPTRPLERGTVCSRGNMEHRSLIECNAICG